jgi:hypothetical protein
MKIIPVSGFFISIVLYKYNHLPEIIGTDSLPSFKQAVPSIIFIFAIHKFTNFHSGS